MKDVMRKRFFGLIACLAMLLCAGLVASCESEDGPDVGVPDVGVPDVSAELLTGSWKLMQEKGWSMVAGKKDVYTDDLSAQNRVYEFRADGTLVDRLNVRTGTWSLSGNKLMMMGEESYIVSYNSNRMVTEYYTDIEYKQSTYQRVN